MYDSSRKRLFSELTITLKFNWGFKYRLEFFNDENQKSNKYIYFIDRKGESLESALFKLVLVAQKKEKYQYKFIISFKQYAYAYMMFLFYKNETRIFATIFSLHYKVFTNMERLITYELSDNTNMRHYSEDTIYYKVLQRYVKRQKEYLKNIEITYN